MMGRYWSVLVRHLCCPISERKEAVLISTSGLQLGVLMVRFLNWQHQHPLELVRNTDSWDQPQTYRLNTLRVGPSKLGFNKPSGWFWWHTSLVTTALESILSSSVTHSRPTLCDPMNCSTPGFPVLHHLPEFAQTHVHWVSDAIQPSHPLSSPSPLALNLSQH